MVWQEEMIKDVEELFEDHPELIPGFRIFMTGGKRARNVGASEEQK
jgi:histone deacetylase complex regulatory component SIN3